MSKPLAASPAARVNASGGSAAAGGMNLHARMAAVAAVHLLGQRPLGWLKELEVDTPIEVWCETNGPGDDLRLVLANGSVVEAQVKKGLARGDDLWTALVALAHGIHQRSIAYGVLIVDAAASDTIRSGLARGIVRLGDGRTDSLDDITSDFKRRLEDAGMTVQPTCQKLRIVVLHCADHDDASEAVAKSELARLCATERDVTAAWQALQLSAHNLIERRGRWTAEALSGVLRTASVELHARPGDNSSVSLSGSAWEHLDDVSQHRGFVLAFRQHYLVSEQMAAQAFGGRDAECKRLDTWLFDADAPSRMLISGPTARGKSALLVHWTERLGSDATWTVVFVPISLRFGTDRPAVFYALLATQLASVLKRKLVPPATDLEGYYQGISAELLSQAAKQAQHVLVVLDGLDEAQGAGFNPTVFPPALPPNIKVLVSAREQAGDRGPEGWLKRLDWQGRAASEGLSILDHQAVAPILESVGLATESITEALIDRLMVLSVGEPLLLALYAEDLSAIARSGASVGVKTLEGMSPGFAPYFSRAFDAQRSTGEQEDQETVDMTLAVLAMALGPVEGTHLTDLVCSLCHLRRPAASDRFVRPLKRFIAGDGSVDHGYVLNHPKLGEYLREERFDSTTRKGVQQAFLDWGRGVAKGLVADPNAPGPTYVLRYHVNHLSQSAAASLDDIELLLSDGWREAWHRLDKDFIGYADSLLAASAMMRACAAYRDDASRALRLKVRIALSVGSVTSQGANVPSELLVMALEEQLITLRQALNVAELQVPENRPDYLVSLAASLSAADLERVLSDVHEVANAENRVDHLARLAPHLRGARRNEVVGSVLSSLRAAGDSRLRMGTIAALAPALEDTQLDDLLADAISKTLTAQEAPSAVIALAPTIATLRKRQKHELAERLVERCLHWTEIAADPLLAVEALGTLATQISADRLETQIARLAPVVKAIQAHSSLGSGTSGFEAEMRRERVTKALVTVEILAIHRLPAEAYETQLLAALAPLLVPGFWTVDSLVRVVPMIRADTQQKVVALCHELALNLPTANNRTHALMALARTALPPLRKPIIGQALTDARRIEDDYSRSLTLVSLFATLPAAERERDITALMSDIQKVGYVLHFGELLLQVANHAPGAAGLVEVGVQAIQKAQDSRNRVSTLLREIARLPQQKREVVFRQCWQQILTRTDNWPQFQIGMAARYAGEYWTTDELGVARSELAGMSPDQRVHVLVDLLSVATKLGAQDLVDEAFEHISAQKDPNDGLSYMVQALKFLPLRDARRDLLRQNWFLALDSDKPRISSLIDGFEVLDTEHQSVAWPKLKACAKLSPQAGHSLARLSAISKSSLERVELLEAALLACAAEKADHRIPAAAQIVVTCRSQDERLRAFDLLAAAPAVARETVLSAMRIAAPGFAEVGGTSLTQALMRDVRQVARWWP